MIRERALASIAATSEAHHAALVAKRAAGDLFYDPDPTVLYVHEMHVYDEPWGGRGRHEYTRLFASRAALLVDAKQVITSWFVWDSGYRSDDRVCKMLDADEVEKAIEYVGSHYGVKRIEIRLVPVHTREEAASKEKP